MKRNTKFISGNEAASYIAYAYTDVSAVYPIATACDISDNFEKWSYEGRKNAFGNNVLVQRMQSGAGVAGVFHGALNVGALSTAAADSQSLLLMIPNMYKVAGELLPGVIYVPTKAVSVHASTDGSDYSDVMACRQTGFAMLVQNNPQEIMDLAPIAHMSAIEGSIPFIDFYDGDYCAREMNNVECWDYSDLAELIDENKIRQFRSRALNSNHPVMRGSHENGDIFFQNREASNSYYDKLPTIVEDNMKKINSLLGTDYGIFNYYGSSDAENVIVAMGSVCDTARQVVDELVGAGERVGLICVRLFRPFSSERLLSLIPKTVKNIAVLDKSKESGSQGQALYQDVIAAISGSELNCNVLGGIYGIGSKVVYPSHIHSLFLKLKVSELENQFSLGINSTEYNCGCSSKSKVKSIKIWGKSSDIGEEFTKNISEMFFDNTDLYIQDYCQKNNDKSYGVCVGNLRFSEERISKHYPIQYADIVVCQNIDFFRNGYKLAKNVAQNGCFIINTSLSVDELSDILPDEEKRILSDRKAKLYLIDADNTARQAGMGKRIDVVLQSALLHVAEVIEETESVNFQKERLERLYSDKSEDIIKLYKSAVDAGISNINEYPIPEQWSACSYDTSELDINNYIETLRGDELPVSAFDNCADGSFEIKPRKHGNVAFTATVPSWNQDKCLQCNNCAFSCPNASLRPFMLDLEEAANAPQSAKLERVKSGKGKGIYKYTMAISPMDCYGCSVCIGQCPTHALEMKPIATQMPQQEVFDYIIENVKEKPEMFDLTVRFSQYQPPLLKQAQACPGCTQTSYIRVLTQLFGSRMIISNATGCSSLWGGVAGNSPYTVNQKGKGPAWANSLLEDNAEHGLGIYIASTKHRSDIAKKIRELIETPSVNNDLKMAAEAWLDKYYLGENDEAESEKLIEELQNGVLKVNDAIQFLSTDNALEVLGEKRDLFLAHMKQLQENNTEFCDCPACQKAREILDYKDYINKKSIWIIGGDGWANDAGFGGLDHVLASGENVNILVLDNEISSSTGGQATKATNPAQRTNYGKNKHKPKDLAAIAMTYGYVYVAQIAMGGDKGQTLKAFAEAESYNGPSLIIAYAPCEKHGIKGGMQGSQREMDRAVKCGYWPLFRFNPSAQGSKFSLDSKHPNLDYSDYLSGEARFEEALNEKLELKEISEKSSLSRFEYLHSLVDLYYTE